MPITQNQALFSLLGTTYGGDGLHCQICVDELLCMHYGHGPGLTSRLIGQKSGSESITLTTAEIPSHNHIMQPVKASAMTPGSKYAVVSDTYQPSDGTPNPNLLGTNTVMPTGGGQADYNMQPYLFIK